MTSSQYAPTVVQTISNPDGTVSIIHVDSSNPVITLPDGTTAQVQVSFEFDSFLYLKNAKCYIIFTLLY
jgi:hypothetical protein